MHADGEGQLWRRLMRHSSNNDEETSNAGLQHRHGGVGRGVHPPSTPQLQPQRIKAFRTLDQRTDGQTDGWTKPLIESIVRD